LLQIINLVIDWEDIKIPAVEFINALVSRQAQHINDLVIALEEDGEDNQELLQRDMEESSEVVYVSDVVTGLLKHINKYQLKWNFQPFVELLGKCLQVRSKCKLLILSVCV